MERSKKIRRVLLVANALGAFLVAVPLLTQSQTDDPIAASLEAARRKRDEFQLESLKTQIEQRINQNPSDALSEYQLALVQSYLADVAERKKDKKAASAAVDKAVEADQRSIQLNDKSSDTHSLLADLYGRKISLGIGMFAGPAITSGTFRPSLAYAR